MRRGSRDFRRTSTKQRSLFSPVLALAAGRPVFNADLVIVDGGTGKVRSIVDWNNNTRILDQAVGASQVALPAAHADYGGRLCFTFTRAQFYASNQPAASFQFLHDGTGGIYAVCTPTDLTVQSDFINTRGGSGTDVPGCEVRWTAASNLQYLSLNSGTAGVNQTRALVVNTPTQFCAQWNEGTSPEYALKTTGQAELTGDSAAAPTASPSGATLIFGGTVIGSNLLPARVWGFALTPPLSAADRATMRSALQVITTVAA